MVECYIATSDVKQGSSGFIFFTEKDAQIFAEKTPGIKLIFKCKMELKKQKEKAEGYYCEDVGYDGYDEKYL